MGSGGFTKDAYYDADRAAAPWTLWTMDTVVRVLTEHYDGADTETNAWSRSSAFAFLPDRV